MGSVPRKHLVMAASSEDAAMEHMERGLEKQRLCWNALNMDDSSHDMIWVGRMSVKDLNGLWWKLSPRTGKEHPASYEEATSDYEEMQTQFSWDDQAIRRIFIRKCTSEVLHSDTPPPVHVLLETVSLEPCSAGSLYSQPGLHDGLCVQIDFTSYQGVLFVLTTVMLFCCITLSTVIPFGYMSWLQAIYAVIGAILSTLVSGRYSTHIHHWEGPEFFLVKFLAFDTQLLIGNKRHAMSPEEYVFATLNLYLDIVNLFKGASQ
uniref:uncharacterized protein LOC124004161 n=1 Tax=Oncorhynchus gorbuscha TaxID=8017 RepID=UPI001EAF660A|nr:uncharacterized protein LOC124004161 [Oncorhynchus gorbuscha]